MVSFFMQVVKDFLSKKDLKVPLHVMMTMRSIFSMNFVGFVITLSCFEGWRTEATMEVPRPWLHVDGEFTKRRVSRALRASDVPYLWSNMGSMGTDFTFFYKTDQIWKYEVYDRTYTPPNKPKTYEVCYIKQDLH